MTVWYGLDADNAGWNGDNENVLGIRCWKYCWESDTVYSCLEGATRCQLGNATNGWGSEPDGWFGVSITVAWWCAMWSDREQ